MDDLPEPCIPTDFMRLLRPEPEKVVPRYLFWRLWSGWTEGETLAYERRTTGIRNLAVKDYLASRGKGVSYGLTVPASPDNYVNQYASGYTGQTITPYSMLIPFTYAGVAGVYMARQPAQLGPDGFVFDRSHVRKRPDWSYAPA